MRPWALWVVWLVLWLEATAAGDQYVEYDMTLLEDPLQPIWDRLEGISKDVLADFKLQMAQYLRQTQDKLEVLNLKISALEDKLDYSVTSLQSQVMEMAGQMTSMEAHVREDLRSLSTRMTSTGDTLSDVSSSVISIDQKVSSVEDAARAADTRNCTSLVDEVSRLMNEQRLANEVPTVNGSQVAGGDLSFEIVEELTSAVAKLRDSPALISQDCSDLHWNQPEAPSGVYQTYPTKDPKLPVTVWCDMGQDGAKSTGGWTVILRRHNTSWGLTDFNRTWSDYREGFGVPGEGEWWYGLASLHALTYRQPYEAHFLMHDIEKGFYDAYYSIFRVEDESSFFRVLVGGFSGNVSFDAFSSQHQGQPFSTVDADRDDWGSGNCASSNGGGWWYNRCHRTALTATFPTSDDREAKTIRWFASQWLVLDDVTVKVRPSRYDLRFDSLNHVN